MSKTYDHHAIEAKWQAYWEEHRPFRAVEDPAKPKFYCLDMFPYPSGSGLHVGHLEGYTATDIVSRYKRMRGFNVLHPMGWDAFGLPAEQYAVKTGIHPAITTAQNIATFKRQMKACRTVLRLGPRNQYDRPRLLSLDAMDFLATVQARSGLRGGSARQLVSGAGNGAGQRRDRRRQERSRRVRRHAQADAAMGVEDHGLCGSAASTI